MLTLIQIYQAFKEIADLALTAKDLPDLVNQIRGLDAGGIYLHALEEVLKQEQGVFLEKGINFDFNINIFKKKLYQNGIDFEQLAVSPDILNQQIGQQVASWLLTDDVLMGVDIGVEVDSGWAQRVAQATNEHYASALYEKLFNDAVKQELRYISNQVSENKKTQNDVNQLLVLSGEIIAQLKTDYTSLNKKSVQELFGISAYLVELNKIKPAPQERLRSFYKGDPLWWDIIVANGDVKRDLAEEIFNKFALYPENLRMLCISGESGSGKSTLAWRVASNISTNLALPIIQLRNNESEEFWYLLENGVNQYGKPIIVLVDDVFRHTNSTRALASINPETPAIVISTSRLNEIPDDLLIHFAVDFVLLGSPTSDEIRRALEKTSSPDTKNYNQTEMLEKAASWLVLMYEITTGEEFSKHISDTVKRLKNQDEIVYKAYEYLCFTGQFDIAIPVKLLERLNKNGDFYDVIHRQAAKGLIYFAVSSIDYYRAQHSVIAKFSLAVYKREPQKILSELIESCDPMDQRQTYFVAFLLLRIMNEKQIELVRISLGIAQKLIRFDQQSLLNLSLWHKIFEQLGDLELDNKLKNTIREHALLGLYSSQVEWFIAKQSIEDDEQATIEFVDKTSEWLLLHPTDYGVRQGYLKFIEQKGTPEQIKDVIQSTTQWLQKNPDDAATVWQVYIGLIERKGTPEQIQEVIQSTAQWLQRHPDDVNVRQVYIGMIGRKGTPEQIQEVIQSTAQWLDVHPADNFVRHNFPWFVVRKGTSEQILEVIQSTAQWLQKHPDDYTVRQVYIGLIKRKGTPEQIQEVIQSTAQWLQKHPSDNFVRKAYLKFIKWIGTPEQIQDSIRMTVQWLQDYPQKETVRSSFLNLIEQLAGDQDGSIQHRIPKSLYAEWLLNHPDGEFVQQYYIGLREKSLDDDVIQNVIQETIKWVQENPEDEFIRQFYLDLIKREGSIEQIQDVIQSTFQWLNDGHGDEKIRKNYLHIVGKKGNPQQIRAAIHQAEVWLQEMPDLSELLPIFIGLVDRYGTKEIVKYLLVLVPKWLEAHPNDALIRQTYLLLIINVGTRQEKADEIAKLEEWISSIYFDSLNDFNKALILSRYGRLLLSMDRFGKAEEISKKALNEFKGMVTARINLAWSFYYKNKKKDALNELKHSLWWAEKKQRHPESDVYFQLGHYWFMEHDYGYAEEFFRKAIRFLNANPSSYKYNPYKYYIELGRTLTVLRDKRAIKVLQEAKEMISDKLVDDAVIDDLDQLIEKAAKLTKEHM